MEMYFDLAFRPHQAPAAPLPFSARSVGHVCQSAGKQDRTTGSSVQLFWEVSGTIRFTVNGRTSALGPGQVLVTMPGVLREWEGLTTPWILRWLTLDGDMAADTVRQLGLPMGIKDAGACPERLFTELEHRIRDASPVGERLASATAYAILCHAAAHHRRTSEVPPLVDRCTRLVKENFTDPGTNVDWLAARLGVNRSALSRLFIREKGLALSRYLASLRLQRAMYLLRATEFKLHAVAASCGFTDIGYFCRAFRKRMGRTPTEFRKQTSR